MYFLLHMVHEHQLPIADYLFIIPTKNIGADSYLMSDIEQYILSHEYSREQLEIAARYVLFVRLLWRQSVDVYSRVRSQSMWATVVSGSSLRKIFSRRVWKGKMTAMS